MRYVQLGRTGLAVSPVCIGGNSWGAAGRRDWGAFDEAASRPFFRKALDVGINFFDTADTYNAGESERILGRVLLEYAPRDEVVICAKIGIPMGTGPNRGGNSRKYLMAALDASLSRLGTDHVDLLLIHRTDGITPIAEMMRALDDMVRAGKVRYVGGSTMPAYRFAQMIGVAEANGWARPVAMQNLYNLVQREEEREMNRLCAEAGVGLVPYSPLARGFLAANRRPEGGGETERAKTDRLAQGIYRPCDFAVADAVAALAAARGVKPTQIALAWLLHKPAMAAPVIGTTRLEHIEDAAAAVDIRLTAEEIAALEAPYEPRATPLG